MPDPVAVVTGASSGLGRVIAEHIASLGYRVFGGVSELPKEARAFEPLLLDVRSSESAVHCVARVLERVGRIDVLVNQASVLLGGALELHSDEDTARIMDTNLGGTFRLCRAVLPHMRARQSGRIINVSSMRLPDSMPFHAVYLASQFALEGLTESLGLEVRSFGIHVSLLQLRNLSMDPAGKYSLTDWAKNDRAYLMDTKKALEALPPKVATNADLSPFLRCLNRLLRDPSPKPRCIVEPAKGWLGRIRKRLG
jgi:NAD(P)-dependent dehydrogenase (short-subunit alcohol dehydrogenase family)